MRYLLIALIFTVFPLQAQEQETLPWLTNLEKAKKIAKKESKPILLYFTGSDWCAPCKMLKEDFFNHQDFKTLSKELVLVMIDYPRRVDIISEEQLVYNKEIIAALNPEKTFPKLLALNHRGKEIDKISGYSSLRDTTHHFTFLNKLLKK